jgi:hypothetical protein
MGEFEEGFDFELYERILEKLSSGGALTPEEQAAYDSLFTSGNSGVNLTGEPDFQQLVQAYYADVSANAKRQFEQIYGKGVVETPNGIVFTEPGTAIEQKMRQGLSVRDPAVQAILTKGLSDYTREDNELRQRALTQGYTSAQGTRQQNLNAVRDAGLLAQGAANRRVGAIGGARRSSGGGGGMPEPLRLPLPPQPDQPDLWERLLPGIIGLGGTAALAEWNRSRNQSQREGNRPTNERLQRFEQSEVPQPPVRPYPSNDPYDTIENQRSTQPSDPYSSQNPLADPQYTEDTLLTMPPGAAAGSANSIAPSFGGVGTIPNMQPTQSFITPASTMGSYTPPSYEQNPYDPSWTDAGSYLPQYSPSVDLSGWDSQYSQPAYQDQSWYDIDQYMQPTQYQDWGQYYNDYDYGYDLDSGGYWW